MEHVIINLRTMMDEKKKQLEPVFHLMALLSVNTELALQSLEATDDSLPDLAKLKAIQALRDLVLEAIHDTDPKVVERLDKTIDWVPRNTKDQIRDRLNRLDRETRFLVGDLELMDFVDNIPQMRGESEEEARPKTLPQYHQRRDRILAACASANLIES